MNNAGDVAKQSQYDIDPKLGGKAHLHRDPDGRQDDRQDNAEQVTARAVCGWFCHNLKSLFLRAEIWCAIEMACHVMSGASKNAAKCLCDCDATGR